MAKDEPLRVYLAGTICLARGNVLLTEDRLPGRQGRLTFALLTGERHRALSREEIAQELWGDRPPRSWDTALRAIVSKLRSVLSEVGMGADRSIPFAFGCYQLRLPTDPWVDLEAADDAVHRAEGALRVGRPDEANGWALVANAIARRDLLPGEEGPWASRRRDMLRDVRVRALECRAAVGIHKGQFPLAARDAELVLGLEPFRETAYQLLMRAHAGSGNPAEALRVYERCRAVVAAELGVGPSPDTEALYLQILRSS